LQHGAAQKCARVALPRRKYSRSGFVDREPYCASTIKDGRRHQPFAIGLAFLDPFESREPILGNLDLQEHSAASAFAIVERPI
jgi:hypothetical protein